VDLFELTELPHLNRPKQQNKYRSLSNDFDFVAVGVETSGVLGKQASKFLKELGKKLISATEEPRSSSAPVSVFLP